MRDDGYRAIPGELAVALARRLGSQSPRGGFSISCTEWRDVLARFKDQGAA